MATGEQGGRRAPAMRWARPGRLLRDLEMVALLVLIAAASGLLLLPRTDDGLLGLPELRLGDRSPRTVKSPTHLVVEDPEMTARARARAVAGVPAAYDRLAWMGDGAKQRIRAAFEAAASEPSDARRRTEAFLLELGAALDEQRLRALLEADNPDELRDAMIMVAQTVYQSPIVQDRPYLGLRVAPHGVSVRVVDRAGAVQGETRLESAAGVLGIDQARARVDAVVAARLGHLPPAQRRAVAWVVKEILRPNLVPNEAESERRERARARSVRPVVLALAAGDPVIRAGETVNRQHLLILRGLESELDAQSRLQAALGSALMMVVLVAFAYRVARRSYRPRPRHRDLVFLASTFVLVLGLLWLGYKGVLSAVEAHPELPAEALRYALPVAFGTALVRLVAGLEAAAVLTPVVGLAAAWMMDGSLAYATYAITGALAAASAPDAKQPRRLVWSVGARACVGHGGAVLALALLSSSLDAPGLGLRLGAAVFSAVTATAAAAALVPLIEVLFGYTTAYRLSDLANLNHPLLRDLLVEAPQTYHHAILVGTLAEAGADAVGANPLLARVGGYYHDIGKLENPRLYAENDAEGLFGLSPEAQAEELRAHVADGLALGARHRLGAPVLEIVAQHHGSSVVRSARARAEQRAGMPVDAGPFRYGGPRPLSREAALVMLADAVETASRDLAHHVGLDRARVEGRVRHVVTEVLEDGQLDLCDMTLRDLSQVVSAFTDVLEGRLIRQGRPPTLSSLPAANPVPLVRPPPGGEPN